MIHFMIDLENTHSQGLQGAGFLTADDYVTIFYSRSCDRIEQGKMRQIVDSHCTLNICKLINEGKNALDFYLASKIGEVYGMGYAGIVAIVSNDKGFQAVVDYWKKCVEHSRNVILRPNIAQCIISSNENSVRQLKVKEQLQAVNLEMEYARYQERIKIRKKLENEFSSTEYENLIEQIQEILQGQPGPRTIYLNILKRFGKKDGLMIYNRMKALF